MTDNLTIHQQYNKYYHKIDRMLQQNNFHITQNNLQRALELPAQDIKFIVLNFIAHRLQPIHASIAHNQHALAIEPLEKLKKPATDTQLNGGLIMVIYSLATCLYARNQSENQDRLRAQRYFQQYIKLTTGHNHLNPDNKNDEAKKIKTSVVGSCQYLGKIHKKNKKWTSAQQPFGSAKIGWSSYFFMVMIKNTLNLY